MGFMFALGILFSTFVFSLFFMNLPVQGEPVDIADFFRAKFRLHALGFLGGIVWYSGMLAVLIVNRLEPPAAVQPSLSFGIPQAGILVAALCGLLLWREFGGLRGECEDPNRIDDFPACDRDWPLGSFAGPRTVDALE